MMEEENLDDVEVKSEVSSTESMTLAYMKEELLISESDTDEEEDARDPLEVNEEANSAGSAKKPKRSMRITVQPDISHLEADSEITTQLKVSCIICGKHWDSSKKLKNHIHLVHLKGIGHFCHICNDKFLTAKILRAHLKHHARQNKFMAGILCMVCGKPSKTKACLSRHMKRSHPGPERNSFCTICNKLYKSPHALDHHTRQVHPREEESMLCMLCGRACKSKKGLREHIQIVHTTEEDIVYCNTCNVKFKSKKSLSVHNRKFHNHNGIEKYCPICDKNIKFYKMCSAADTIANNKVIYCMICYDKCVPGLHRQPKPRVIHVKCQECVPCSICQQIIPLNHVLVPRAKNHPKVKEEKQETTHSSFGPQWDPLPAENSNSSSPNLASNATSRTIDYHAGNRSIVDPPLKKAVPPVIGSAIQRNIPPSMGPAIYRDAGPYIYRDIEPPINRDTGPGIQRDVVIHRDLANAIHREACAIQREAAIHRDIASGFHRDMLPPIHRDIPPSMDYSMKRSYPPHVDQSMRRISEYHDPRMANSKEKNGHLSAMA